MARLLTMVLSSTWPGVACNPWQPIRRSGVPFKEEGNGGLTGGDGNARDYSVENPALTRHNGTWGQPRGVRALYQSGLAGRASQLGSRLVGYESADASSARGFSAIVVERTVAPSSGLGALSIFSQW